MTVSSPLRVRALLFARYAELLGCDALELELPAGATVADAVHLVRQLPGGERLPARPLVARALAQVTPDAPLEAGDELAILPPMAGG